MLEPTTKFLAFKDVGAPQQYAGLAVLSKEHTQSTFYYAIAEKKWYRVTYSMKKYYRIWNTPTYNKGYYNKGYYPEPITNLQHIPKCFQAWALLLG